MSFLLKFFYKKQVLNFNKIGRITINLYDVEGDEDRGKLQISKQKILDTIEGFSNRSFSFEVNTFNKDVFDLNAKTMPESHLSILSQILDMYMTFCPRKEKPRSYATRRMVSKFYGLSYFATKDIEPSNAAWFQRIPKPDFRTKIASFMKNVLSHTELTLLVDRCFDKTVLVELGMIGEQKIDTILNYSEDFFTVLNLNYTYLKRSDLDIEY